MEREKSYEGSSAKKDAVCRHSAAHRTAVRVRPFRSRLVPGSSRLYSAALEEKQTTVLELSAASAAASAAITLIPGDVATPIADKLPI